MTTLLGYFHNPLYCSVCLTVCIPGALVTPAPNLSTDVLHDPRVWKGENVTCIQYIWSLIFSWFVLGLLINYWLKPWRLFHPWHSSTIGTILLHTNLSHLSASWSGCNLKQQAGRHYMRNTSVDFCCIIGLVAKMQCQHSELYHTEQPGPDPAMGSQTEENQQDTVPGLLFSVLSCSVAHEMSETGSIPWNHWYEKAGIPPLPWPWETAHPLSRNAAPQEGSLRGWGRVQGRLGAAGTHSRSLGTASLGGSKGHQLLLARNCFRKRRENARDTSQEGPRELSAGSSSKEQKAVLQKWRQKLQKIKLKIQSYQ